MQNQQTTGGLDRFRILAALLVIAIHTSPLLAWNTEADFFLTRILARVAVPFFFMVTGQFVLADYLSGGRKNPSRLYKSIKKTALLYGISIALYLPIGMYAGLYENLTLSAAVRMLLFDGTFYHLWYFPACILGLLVVALMSRFLRGRAMMAAAAALYLIGLLGDSYYGVIQGVPFLVDLYDFGFRFFSYTRNGLFLAPVFLLLGATLKKRDVVSKPYVQWGGLAVSLLLMILEASLLRKFGLQRHDSMYLFLLPAMFFLYEILLSWDKNPSPFCRTAATWIYMLHPAMIVLVRGAAKVFHVTSIFCDNNLVHFFTVSLLSVGAAGILSSFTQRFQKVRRSPSRAWIELDRSALRQNITALRAKLPETCRLMPALKANAYGHGAVWVAKELRKMGVDAFCVACVSEGIELRRQGVKGEILILGFTPPEQFALLRRYHLAQTVVDYAYAQQLNRFGKKLHVHIGIDTGMHRLGERSDQLDRLCAMYQMKHLHIDGMFTHFCAAEGCGPVAQRATEAQAQAFYSAAEQLKARGCPQTKLHLQSSAGILNYPSFTGEYARPGIGVYGVLSTKEETEAWKNELRPVLSLKTRVAAVKALHAGESVSYGMQFTASCEMKIATLSIGYADGLPRALSNGNGATLIGGHKCRILGRVCMDLTVVDVSAVPNVQAGDTAVLIGTSGEVEISACDLAEQAGTITNEILSRLGTRLERVSVE